MRPKKILTILLTIVCLAAFAPATQAEAGKVYPLLTMLAYGNRQDKVTYQVNFKSLKFHDRGDIPPERLTATYEIKKEGRQRGHVNFYKAGTKICWTDVILNVKSDSGGFLYFDSAELANTGSVSSDVKKGAPACNIKGEWVEVSRRSVVFSVVVN